MGTLADHWPDGANTDDLKAVVQERAGRIAEKRAHRVLDRQVNNAAMTAAPASMPEAIAEYDGCRDAITSINRQLAEADGSLADEEYRSWRFRANDAKRNYERRARFLRAWIAERRTELVQLTTLASGESLMRRATAINEGASTTMVMKEVIKRIGQLEAVWCAVRDFMEEDTDESWSELNRIHDAALNHLGDPRKSKRADPATN